MGTLKADRIVSTTGNATSAPITLSGDTATLDNVTLGSSVAGLPVSKINNVFRFIDSTSGTCNLNTSTITVATNAKSFSAVSGRHYIITGMQNATAYRIGGTLAHRYVVVHLYYGTADKAINDRASLGTSLYYQDLGRMIETSASITATSYGLFSYNACFTAASTATHYVYTAASTAGENIGSNLYNSTTSPHYTIIYEVLP